MTKTTTNINHKKTNKKKNDKKKEMNKLITSIDKKEEGKDETKNKASSTVFASSVYEKCSQIPHGYVSTYKEIAIALKKPNAFRAVGTALKRNPYAPVVPCHRVVAGDRTLGGFFGSTDVLGTQLKKKKEMLIKETVQFDDNGKVSEKCLYKFD